MRNILASAVLLTCAALALTSAPVPARAESAAPTANITACGFPVSPATFAIWRDLDAETGRLGCAVQPERPGPASPQGSASSVAVFASGEVVQHTGGPRTGQGFAVAGCFYRLYVQFGGASSWLGLPVGDAENTPDGARQTFEGGDMRYTRAYDDCQANHATGSDAAAPAAAIADSIPLDLFENPSTGDHVSLASQRSVEIALAAGYQRSRSQARLLSTGQPGAAPLKLYQNEDRGLRRTLAAPQSERDAQAEGFVFEASQGFVWTAPHPGAVALKLYRMPDTGAARLTAGAADEAEAVAAGLTFQRVEGYAAPPS